MSSLSTALPSNLKDVHHLLHLEGVCIGFFCTYTPDPQSWGEYWRLDINCSELNSLFRSEAVVTPQYGSRQPTPFGAGLLADFITDHLDRLASVATLYPGSDPKAMLLLWRDWCRTQFERSQQ